MTCRTNGLGGVDIGCPVEPKVLRQEFMGSLQALNALMSNQALIIVVKRRSRRTAIDAPQKLKGPKGPSLPGKPK